MTVRRPKRTKRPVGKQLITAEEEALVTRLVTDFSEKAMHGDVSMEKYLAQCPNERVRTKFLELANIDQLLHLAASLKRGERPLE